VNMIVQENLPLSLVNKPTFKEYSHAMNHILP